MAAILWEKSLIPWTDPSGDPYAGAKAYFFDAGTTTPQATYTDAALSVPHDHPVVADSQGQFPAIFLQQGTYRLRILDADDATIHDVDEISVPINTPAEVPEGDTPIELLARTGDLKPRYGTGSHSGWVRANGRTIGDGASGATERANADTEDLFEYLWTTDAGLTVSGGRGASAAADFAASKTIALPDIRGRALVGLSAMGNSDSGLIDSSLVDSTDDADDLGATAGADDHTLTSNQMPAHTHAPGTLAGGWHQHSTNTVLTGGGGQFGLVREGNGNNSSSLSVSAETVSINGASASTGGGAAHNNIQPSMFVTIYIKL